MIRDVWKLNVCTVMLLPLLNNITKDLNSGKITFTQLSFLYGLKSCYLHNKLLALVFNKEDCTKDITISKKNKIHWSEYLISAEGFSTFEMTNDHMIFYFDINISDQDLQNIKSAKYSKLSVEFCNRINVFAYYKNLVTTDNKLADFLSLQNIARAIVGKENYMKNLIQDTLKVRLPDNAEYFKEFIKEKEFLNKNNL